MRATLSASLIGTTLAGALLLSACSSGGSSTTAAPSTKTPEPVATESADHTNKPQPQKSAVVSPQKPVAPESNPPGDIPDNTQYGTYTSKSGNFKISIPDGWSRKSAKSSVTWSDKLNVVTVQWQPANSAPTVGSAKNREVPQLQQSLSAFRLQGVKSASLPAGPAVLLTYQDNSKANPVTGKQYRLVILRYELYRNGTEAVVTLSSPVGADNVDPWNTISQSFGWA